jgi:hypothetical protein
LGEKCANVKVPVRIKLIRFYFSCPDSSNGTS